MASLYIDADITTYQPGETICGTLHVVVRKALVTARCIHLVLRATETATIRVEPNEATAKKADNGLYSKVKYTKSALYLQEVKFLLGGLEDKSETHVLTRGRYQYPFRLHITENAPASYYCSMPTGASSKLQYELAATLVGEGDVCPQTSLGIHVGAVVRAAYFGKSRETVTRNLPKGSVAVAKGGKVLISVDMQPWVAVLERYESEGLTREDTVSSVRSTEASLSKAGTGQLANNVVAAHITITNESKADIKEVRVVARQRQRIALDDATSSTQYVASLAKPTVEEIAAAKNDSIISAQGMEVLESIEADADLLPDEECTNATVSIDRFHQEASMETRIAMVTLTDLPNDAIKPGQTVTLTARLKLPRETRTTFTQHKAVPLPSITTAFLQTSIALEVSFPGVEIKGAPYTADKAFFVASSIDPTNRALDVPIKYAAAAPV